MIKIILIPLILLTAIGCEQINELTQPKPKDVLTTYLNLSLKMNSEKAYEYASVEDKKIKNLSEYKKGMPKNDSDLLIMFKNNVSFKVIKVTRTGNAALIDIEITEPDFSVMIEEYIENASMGWEEVEGAIIEGAIVKKYEGVNLPTKTTIKEFKMRKETDGWKVFLDWKAEKAKKEQEEKDRLISHLETEAILLRSEQLLNKKSITKMNEELQKYDEIIKLDENNEEAKTNREILLEKIELFKKNGYWDVRISSSPIDDSKTVILSLEADSGKNKWGKKPTLTVRCKENSTDFYINWNSYLGSDADVLTRIGSSKAITSRWSMSTDKESTFHTDPISFLISGITFNIIS